VAAGAKAATAGGALAVKIGVAGIVALGAIGGTFAVGLATKAPPRVPEVATVAPSVPIASSAPFMEAPSPEVPRAEEPSSAAVATVAPHVAASAAPGSTIKAEMALFAEARKALASDPGRALALAEEGHARFPRGVFGQEREALAISALVKLGRTDEAKARARAFVQRHPESPMAEGLRKLAEGE
jgi:hypothetical protein